MIGCDCAVCCSTDARDRRLRTSVHLEVQGISMLIDTTPDLRLQALTHDIRRIDAVMLTHAHADHLMGMDEIRRFNVLGGGRTIPVYGLATTLADVRRTFAYAFEPDAPRGGGVPDVDLTPVDGPFAVGPVATVPVPLHHGPWPALGYRIGRFAYLTDCNAIPATSWDLLRGLDVVVIDALRHEPHPTHFTLAEAVEAARRIGARRTYFTHIAHELGHADTAASLPDGMSLAFDGLRLVVD